MFLAEKTVKNYVSSLLAKLGLERRTQAAVLATSSGHHEAAGRRTDARRLSAGEPDGGDRAAGVAASRLIVPPCWATMARLSASPSPAPGMQAVPGVGGAVEPGEQPVPLARPGCRCRRP